MSSSKPALSVLGLALLLVRALPYSAAELLARLVVLAYLAARPDYRAEIVNNRRIATGRSPRLFWLTNGLHVGRNLALMARLGTRSGDTIVDTARIYSDNITAGYLEQELHMHMVSFHFGLWEYLPQVFARRGYRVGLVVGRQRDPAVRRQLAQMRNRQRVRAGIEARARSISGFMLDNTSRGNQCWVPVGSVQLRMPTLPFRLASRRGTGVVPAFARLERGRLRIDIGHPTDEKGVAEALLAQVRAHPEEWLFWGKSGGVQAAVPDAPQRRRSSPVSEAA